MSESFLKLRAIDKAFGATRVVHGVDLDFARGEFISLLGPSGCGKTTILRMVAGFERPTSGRIVMDGVDITDMPARERKIGMVFQSYALFPNMDVAANIGFGLKVAGRSAGEIKARVEEMLVLIGLSGFGGRFPFELSGGQQQRVALARALAPKPRMLLLDEPLSALDAKIRVSLRDQIRDIQRELGITTLFVTHDQEEALSISDRIVVLNAGRVEQVGGPLEIYNRPATRFAAGFVGTLNVLKAEVRDVNARRISIEGQETVLPELSGDFFNGQELSLALRPEAISLQPAGGDELRLPGEVLSINFLGSIVRARIKLAQNILEADLFNDNRLPPPVRGQSVEVAIAPSSLLVMRD